MLRAPASECAALAGQQGHARAKAKRSCFAEVWEAGRPAPDYVAARADWCQLVCAVGVESGNGASLAAIHPLPRSAVYGAAPPRTAEKRIGRS